MCVCVRALLCKQRNKLAVVLIEKQEGETGVFIVAHSRRRIGEKTRGLSGSATGTAQVLMWFWLVRKAALELKPGDRTTGCNGAGFGFPTAWLGL